MFFVNVLKNFANLTGKHLCWGRFFNKVAAATLLKEDSNTVLSYKICEIFKNTYFEEHQQTNVSDSKVVS